MVTEHERARGFEYATIAYSRPDIWYGAPVPTPPLAERTVYVAGLVGNGFWDFFYLGTRAVMVTLLDTLALLRSGALVLNTTWPNGARGFAPRGLTKVPLRSSVGMCLECLLMANARDVHGFGMACLNPESVHERFKLLRRAPDCNSCQGALTAFPTTRVSAAGHTRNPCAPILRGAEPTVRPERFPMKCERHAATIINFEGSAHNRVADGPWLRDVIR